MTGELSVTEIMSHKKKPFSSAFIRRFVMNNIPEPYKTELNKAVIYLKKKGCKQIYLFGSLVTGNNNEYSDIDIGVKGVPNGKFLSIYGYLLCNLKVPVDLINFDCNNNFYKELKEYKELIKIG